MRKCISGLPIVVALLAAPAFGQSASLDKCQKEAASQSAKFVSGVAKAMGSCMQKISGAVIKKNSVVADAAKACAGAFRKLENSEDPTKTVFAKAKAKARKKCDPTFNPDLAHTVADVLNSPGLEATNLNTWCTNFDGDGTITDVSEWLDCAFTAGLCQARQQLALDYPRVREWTESIELPAAILALGMDAAQTDAATAVSDLHDALDRFMTDQLTINCGPGVNSCGNGVKDGTDDCDGSDLGGDSCSTVGFRSGTLACGADCHFDVSGCQTGAFPATGQTTSYTATDDGDLELGAPATPHLTDNANGTVSDSRTGLTWEKKDRAGGLHDRGNTYAWVNLNTTFLNLMNNRCNNDESVDCTVGGDAACMGVGGACGFAGYRDWRVPNFHELSTILNYGADNPSTYTAFNTNCVAACTVLTCSCTVSIPYYTSTTYTLDTSQVWTVDFDIGQVVFDPKGTSRRVRGVRGGL